MHSSVEGFQRKKWAKPVLMGAVILLVVLLLTIAAYVYNNLNYYKAPLRATLRAGYVEKQVVLEDGTRLNYVEGPNNGPALFLIHAQGTAWQSYAQVMPDLARNYHVFAVDCHGHGGSDFEPEKYNALYMGQDFIWFIEHVIGEPAVISGHSSGGLLAAWIAANAPDLVLGIVLEDPPLFSSEPDRLEKTFAWVDFFEPIYRFLHQREQDDFTLFYLENSYWIRFFGDGKQGLVNYAASYRMRNPGQRLEFFFLPPSLNRIFHYMESYDIRFGKAFYDGSWMRGFDHTETLSRIACPTVLIHTSWSYDDEGILMAAMSGEDAARAHSLLKKNILVNVVSGHGFHDEKPREFVEIMVEFLDRL